jgi:hypothetical protein
VDVGSFLATTHSISDTNFMNGVNSFIRNGASGSIINDGAIKSGLAGYIALLAPEVRNNGVIIAQKGTVALGAGESYTLQFDSNNTLAEITVTPASIAALVDNGHAIEAPGGLIILSAQAANRLQGGVVNNTGSIRADGIVNDGGVIRIRASDKITNKGIITADAAANSTGNGGQISIISDLTNPNSQTQIDGTLSAQAGALGGNGGFIETSGGKLYLDNSARVSSASTRGISGTWLLDPADFVIDSSNVSAISGALGTAGASSGSNVTILTGTSGPATGSYNSGSGGSASNGDITVNSALSWTGQHILKLDAYRSIHINKTISVPSGGGVSLITNDGGSGGDYDFGQTATGFTGNITFTDTSGSFRTQNGASGTPLNFTLTSSAVGLNATTNYALIASYSEVSYSSAPNTIYSGVLEGLGHTINSLHLTGNGSSHALIGTNYGTLQNFSINGINIQGRDYVAAIAGLNSSVGIIKNTNVIQNSGEIIDGHSFVGGIVGQNNGTITSSSLTQNNGGTIRSAEGTLLGGLTGVNYGRIVSSSTYLGGALFDKNSHGGGFVGKNAGYIGFGYVTFGPHGILQAGNGARMGGLAGSNYGSIISSTVRFASGGIISGRYEGVLGGGNEGGVGGLVGENHGLISRGFVYFDHGGTVGSIEGSGGLVGFNLGSIAASTVGAASGGIVGFCSTGSCVGSDLSNVNYIGKVSLFGVQRGTSNNTFLINNNNYVGAGTSSGLVHRTGGLVGFNGGSVSNSALVTGFIAPPSGFVLQRNDNGTFNISDTGDITPSLLGADLNTQDVTIVSTTGDITFNFPSTPFLTSWTSGHKLTLDAHGSVNFLGAINVPASGSILVNYNYLSGTGGNYNFGLSSSGFAGKITFANTSGSFSTKNNTATAVSFSLVTNPASISGTGKFALIDDVTTSSITSPLTVGMSSGGVFDGLGHLITLNSPISSSKQVGLFATNSGTLQNLGVILAAGSGVRATALSSDNQDVGSLVGANHGLLYNSPDRRHQSLL